MVYPPIAVLANALLAHFCSCALVRKRLIEGAYGYYGSNVGDVTPVGRIE